MRRRCRKVGSPLIGLTPSQRESATSDSATVATTPNAAPKIEIDRCRAVVMPDVGSSNNDLAKYIPECQWRETRECHPLSSYSRSPVQTAYFANFRPCNSETPPRLGKISPINSRMQLTLYLCSSM